MYMYYAYCVVLPFTGGIWERSNIFYLIVDCFFISDVYSYKLIKIFFSFV